MSTRRLEGKVAIITGAASGIGEAAARLFTVNGAIVIIADIQDRLGLEVVASIGPDKCSYKHCDVEDEEQVKAAVDYAVATYGGLDIMYSNAGILCSGTGSIVDLDKRELDRLMAVNVVGSALAIKHGARAMIARGVRGSIVCTASLAGRNAGYATAAYTASKHALLGLVKAAAGDLGPHGIRVNSVSPFMVATGMTMARTPAAAGAAQMVEDACRVLSNLKGVVLKAADVAEAALFLASEESHFISGHDIVVDGGTSVVYSGLSYLRGNMVKHKTVA